MPLDKTRIRALCFDIDGTLSDTDDLWVSRAVKLLHPLRFLFPCGEVQPLARRLLMGLETPGNLVYHWLDHLGLDDELALVFGWLARLGPRRQPDHFWIIHGVQGMLQRLSRHYPLAVVSARGEASSLAFLDQFGLSGHFRVVATAQTCEKTKPFPDPLHWAARQMGFEAHECLMIGDTTVDILAGKAAGAQTLGVLCGFGSEGELRRAGADEILASTALLEEMLLKDK